MKDWIEEHAISLAAGIAIGMAIFYAVQEFKDLIISLALIQQQ